jgi:hypothetical protein
MDPLLLGTASAFGLAASAGLNTTLPLLVVALLARFGLIELAAPFDALASPVTIGGLALLALIEFLGDKVPALDSAVHLLQWPLAAAAGAILFASQTSVIRSVSPEIAILVGLLTASAVHAARASLRPAVTSTTFGLGNPLVSVAEDGAAVTLAGLAVLAPLLGLALALVLVAVLVVAVVLAVRGGRRVLRWTRRDAVAGPRSGV